MPDRANTIELTAPAKVNLHLGIHPGRDERGYHRADSIMIALDLGDDVRVCRSDEPAVSFEPPLSVPIEKSTVYRAVAAFTHDITPETSYSVRVVRKMPGSAGLGSSSADAGTALRGMVQLAGVAADDPRVVAIARSIGADVAFFLDARPALYEGAGDVLVRRLGSVSMPIALVKPETGVSTPAAYAAFDKDPSEPSMPDRMAAALDAGDADAVAGALYNNLAPAACVLAPEVGECLEWLKAQDGVIGAQVTGSGSCSFAICASDEAAQRIAAACPWWACATRTIG